MGIKATIADMEQELTAWRRDIHAHPELGFKEHRTADFVAQKLEEFGVQVFRDIGKTGVVGVLREGNDTQSVGLRADLDALPIQEENAFDHKSTQDGTMHACGHDGHTTMLLGAAKYLAETRNFKGQVNFIFQPAEEGIGGARAMIEDGLFEQFPCDQLFAIHNAPGIPVGKFGASPGIVTAAGAFFDVNFTGRGAHGAFPQDSVDPVVLAAEVINTLQTIVSRNIKPSDTVVLSVTRIHGGEAYNVIPETCSIGGTVRTLSLKALNRVEERLAEICHGLATTHGASADVDFRTIFHPVINDAEVTQLAGDVAAEIVGEGNVMRNLPPGTGSEDFSFMSEKVPSCYLLLGNSDDDHRAPVHNPNYDFNDRTAVYGAAFFAEVTERALKE
ncbi:MAG: M20 aminoacylase family protein [Pseudomonadota bacterium]|nr:M20 aminoacylase family protein [Pseudomonadota bacterium]